MCYPPLLELDGINNGKRMMVEYSSKVKEWLQSIEDMTQPSDKEYTESRYPVFQIADSFQQILVRMRRDFDGVKKGEQQFSVMVEDKYDNIVKQTFDVVNPTNDTNISDERDLEIHNVLTATSNAAEYPENIFEKMMNQYRGTQVKFDIAPKIASSLLKSMNQLYETLSSSIVNNKALDLREDYPAKEAFSNLIERIEQIEREDVFGKSR